MVQTRVPGALVAPLVLLPCTRSTRHCIFFLDFSSPWWQRRISHRCASSFFRLLEDGALSCSFDPFYFMIPNQELRHSCTTKPKVMRKGNNNKDMMRRARTSEQRNIYNKDSNKHMMTRKLLALRVRVLNSAIYKPPPSRLFSQSIRAQYCGAPRSSCVILLYK